jgi:hypothetical protein
MGFDQLVMLDPPDPHERRARSFERIYPEWAARMPGWERVEARDVAFDLKRVHEVVFYRRTR